MIDQGEGIDENIRPLMFGRFWRADPDGMGGTGLGLSIVSEIVQAHGGTLTASNLPQRGGAKFLVELAHH